MSQDFSGQNLQERNFKGQDLTGANFSGADIRGANFSDAILVEADFSHAKAGLPDKWRKIFVAIALQTAGGVGNVVSTGGAFVGYFLGTKYERFLTYPDVFYLISVIAFIILLIFTSKEIKPIFALLVGIAGTFTLVAGLSFGLGIEAIGFWGLPIMFYIAGVFVGLALSLTVAELAGEAFTLGVIINLGFSAVIVVDLCNPQMKNALFMAYMLFGFYPAFEKVRIASIVGALFSIYSVTYISSYLTWRTLKELNESDRWLRNLAVGYGAMKGTNFQRSNLTDANFMQATLRNTDFTEAILTRTWFRGAKKLNYAKVEGTILEKPLIRDLLVSGDGVEKSYVGANFKDTNLRDVHLERANLKETDFTGAILSGAWLEYANLTLAKMVGADLTKAKLTGACVEKCSISSGKLKDVDCRFIYLLERPKEETDDRERRPPTGEFTAGEFTKLFQEIITINERELKAIADLQASINLVILTLESGDFNQGFPLVYAQIFKGDNQLPTRQRGALPPAPEIAEIYHNWQLRYNSWIDIFQTSRINKKLDTKNLNTLVSFPTKDIDELAEDLYDELDKWLSKEQFISISNIIREIFNRSDEFRVVILSENIHVQRLPWHSWQLFNRYKKAEIAIGPSSYDRASKTIPNRSQVRRNQVRILSILGSDDGINTNQDLRAFEELLATSNAEIIPLLKPSRQELNQYLWDEQGWDIICFSGHSSSEIDGSKGWIYINDTYQVTIPELKNGLTTAIERGLQIAIFNSCNGLGLANQLASLHLPQIIVMREPVPDIVAQEFLRHFLTAFARGESFYLSVREARKKLEDLEDQYPCASWLPVICQNPSELPPTWDSLRHKS